MSVTRLRAQAGREIVDVYLETAAVTCKLLDHARVAELWEQPSALAGMRVAGLAGHLARSVILTEPILDAPSRPGEPLSTAEYYLAGGDSRDLDAHANRRVRDTGEDTAAGGAVALASEVHASLERLRPRLTHADLDQTHVWFDRLTALRTVLEARVVEMVIHTDDLATSTGLPSPELPTAALDVTIQVLVEIARLRHSAIAVVRALARRERDSVEALRVL